MKPVITFFLACSLLLAGCSEKRPDVEELSQRFFQYQTQFDQLAELSCRLKASQNMTFHRYRVNTAMDYPEPMASQFLKIDALLKVIGAEDIIFNPDGKPECYLVIVQWSFVFAGDGSSMSYSYLPPKLHEYNPAIHHQDKRNTAEPIYFTKTLANDWYVEYDNTP